MRVGEMVLVVLAVVVTVLVLDMCVKQMVETKTKAILEGSIGQQPQRTTVLGFASGTVLS